MGWSGQVQTEAPHLCSALVDLPVVRGLVVVVVLSPPCGLLIPLPLAIVPAPIRLVCVVFDPPPVSLSLFFSSLNLWFLTPIMLLLTQFKSKKNTSCSRVACCGDEIRGWWDRDRSFWEAFFSMLLFCGLFFVGVAEDGELRTTSQTSSCFVGKCN